MLESLIRKRKNVEKWVFLIHFSFFMGQFVI
jgi:hypothetical protein